jgi:multidrug efflux pump subunit AcrB
MKRPQVPDPGLEIGHGIVSIFVRHSNAANLLMALMIIFGLYSLARINTQFFPSVITETIRVTITWSGASAEDVEANILEVVEPEVRFIDGVETMTAYAREGVGSLHLEFERGTDMQKALSDVEAAVSGVTTLPEDADTPKVSFSKWFDGVARLSISGPYSEAALKTIAKRMRDDLIGRGIDKVTLTGLRDEEISVSVPERELRRLELTLGEISTAIAGNSRDLPSGKLEGAVSRQVRSLSDAQDPTHLRDIEVKSFASGEKITVGDIATIERRFDPDDKEGYSGGRRAIQLYVQRAAAADTLKTAAILDAYLEEITPTLPPGLDVVTYGVRADLLKQRIALLVRNGATGLVLVVTVLFVFLSGRVAFWVAAGIPVAMLATLGIMYVSGQSINMISLFSLIMMLGIVVDDAIVVGEHTATRHTMGDPAAIAAERGAGHMLSPVVAASLTTIAAFAPLFLVRDTIGQIMVALPLVVIAVVIASLVECFLILPGHLAHSLGRVRRVGWSFWRWVFVSLAFAALLIVLARDWSGALGLPEAASTVRHALGELPALAQIFTLAAAALLLGALAEAVFLFIGSRHQSSGHQRTLVRRGLDAGFAWFRDVPFRWLVNLSYAFRYLTVAIAVASLILAIGLLKGGRVDFVFFPSPESETLRARVVFNAGVPRATVVAAVGRIEIALHEAARKLSPDKPLVVTAFATIGEAGRSVGDNLAEIRVQLVPSEDRDIRTPEIARAWRKAVPRIAGIKRFSVVEQHGGPRGRDVDIRFRGGNSALLKAAAEDATVVLSAYPGITGVADDLPYGKPELIIRLTPRGAALGFTGDEIGRQVRNTLEGAVPRRFAEGDEEIAIRVQARLRESGMAALRALELRTPSGAFVPLEEVAELSERQGFSAIQRINGVSSVSVTGDVDLDVTNPGAVLDELRETGAIAEIASRFGVETGFSGRAEERAKAFSDLKLGTLIALAVIYIILAWTFGSYAKPVAVMLIIPFGFVGATAGHWLMGFDLTILSLFGLLGLSGILVNDSIILVARLTERIDAGDTLGQAATGASRDRLRAVLLTSLTTIGGLVPLLFETSRQAQFLMPMAITIVFGLAIATFLVLFLVPAIIGIGGDIGAILNFVANRRAVDHAPLTPAE